MKRLVLCLLLIAPFAYGQNSTTYGKITLQSSACSGAGAGFVEYPLPINTGNVAITLSGTWSGTVQFVASIDGSTWNSISATPLAGGSAVTSATANGSWTAPAGGNQYVCLYASGYSSGTVVVSLGASAAAGTPAGSNGQIQYNNNGAFGGASGGTTNGTHWAFGAGSTIDDAPTSFPDGVPLSPKAVQTISEEYTGTDLENGLYMNLLLDPSTPGITTNGAYGLGVSVTSSGDGNWNNASEVVGMVVQNYFNDTGTGQNEGSTLVGVEGVSLNENSGEIYSTYGTVGMIDNLSDGTIDTTNAGSFSVNNFTTGTISNAVEIQGVFTSNANLTAENDVISALSPVLSGTAAITTAKGLDIQEQAVTGVTTAYGIDQEGDDPNTLTGQTSFGDLISPGILTMADGTAHIATAGGDGWQFNCSDCDTPVTEGVACTASGDHAGALAIQLRGALKCF